MYFGLQLRGSVRSKAIPVASKLVVGNVSLCPKTYPEVMDIAGQKRFPEIMDIVIPGAKFVLFKKFSSYIAHFVSDQMLH